MVLLSKGPSLDLYEPGRYRDWFVWGVNETGAVFPCDVICYLDKWHSINEYAKKNPTATIIRPATHGSHHKGRGVVLYLESMFDVNGPAYSVAKSTTALSIYLAGLWGVREILAVGNDSYHADPEQPYKTTGIYAECITAVMDRPSDNFTAVNGMIRIAVTTQYAKPLTVRWWHKGER
jgi:hypothetical protein